jgi:hypothetical protein
LEYRILGMIGDKAAAQTKTHRSLGIGMLGIAAW